MKALVNDGMAVLIKTDKDKDGWMDVEDGCSLGEVFLKNSCFYILNNRKIDNFQFPQKIHFSEFTFSKFPANARNFCEIGNPSLIF